jgi:hypothetical protein
MAVAQAHQGVGRFTVVCRWVCGAMVAAPLLYWWILGYEGDPYILLLLALLSPIAGLVLFANSLFCLRHFRGRRQILISLGFLLGSAIGVVALFFVLPGFKM